MWFRRKFKHFEFNFRRNICFKWKHINFTWRKNVCLPQKKIKNFWPHPMLGAIYGSKKKIFISDPTLGSSFPSNNTKSFKKKHFCYKIFQIFAFKISDSSLGVRYASGNFKNISSLMLGLLSTLKETCKFSQYFLI